MNIRKGAFRFWVVASVLFVLTFAGFSYDGVHTEFRNAYTDWDAEAAKLGGTTEWPVPCPGAAARGMIGTDYTEKDGTCWYDSRTFRKLYPEYKDLSDHALGAKLHEKAGLPLVEFHPWRSLLKTAAVALAVPVAVLILGWALFWAVAGFKKVEP